MEDLAIGRLFRELRIRLGWRGKDVADRAGISDTLYSVIERGQLERVKVGTVRRVASVLEVRLPFEPRWRGAAIDRVLSSRHSAMAEKVTRLLLGARWEVRPEVSFNWYGERGVVDLVAWRAASRALLLIELKTELVDVGNLLVTTDRRRRLAEVIARPFGWEPAVVGQWVVLAEGRTNARRVAEHRATLRAAFPQDGRSVAGWLAKPGSPASALWFLPDSAGAGHRTASRPTLRVRAPRRRTIGRADPS
jgi:transcriptional regulator with XRE-family HTH domain